MKGGVEKRSWCYRNAVKDSDAKMIIHIIALL